MSVKRFDLNFADPYGFREGMILERAEDGDWVSFEDYKELRAALSELVYEVTHLSPQEDDGSHRCRISKETLLKARLALGEGRE